MIEAVCSALASEIDEGSFVTIGPVKAPHAVVRVVDRGLPVQEATGTVALMLKLLGDTSSTIDATVVVRPVGPHDVPWDAQVHSLSVTSWRSVTAEPTADGGFRFVPERSGPLADGER